MIIIIAKLLWYETNKTFWGMLLLENNQTSQYPVTDYLPITACRIIFYSLLIV